MNLSSTVFISVARNEPNLEPKKSMSLVTSRSRWCAIGVVKAIVETPDGSDFDIDAYDRLIQDLEPHEAIRDLVEAPSRLCSAAERLNDKGVTKKMLSLACGLICGTIKCKPQHRRKVCQRAHFCVPPYADIPDVWSQMITHLLARDAKHHIKIATLLYNEGGDPASLLELDDFPPGLSAAMGISNERLFSAMILVIPPCEKLYKYEYSSEASEDGVDAPLVEDELLQREEQPAGSADGQQDSRADFPSSKKGHSSMP